MQFYIAYFLFNIVHTVLFFLLFMYFPHLYINGPLLSTIPL